MSTMKALLLGLAVLILGGCGYNDIQREDEAVKSAWSEVLNQYQRRADLVPNLVATVKGFAAQEQQVLAQVTEARSRVGSTFCRRLGRLMRCQMRAAVAAAAAALERADWSVAQKAQAAPRAGLHVDTMLANIGGQMAWVLPWIFIPLAASAWRALRAGPRDERRWKPD